MLVNFQPSKMMKCLLVTFLSVFVVLADMFGANLKSMTYFSLQLCKNTDRHFVKITYLGSRDPETEIRTKTLKNVVMLKQNVYSNLSIKTYLIG